MLHPLEGRREQQGEADFDTVAFCVVLNVKVNVCKVFNAFLCTTEEASQCLSTFYLLPLVFYTHSLISLQIFMAVVVSSCLACLCLPLALQSSSM